MLTPVLQQVQQGPSCGTTALAMALSSLCQPNGETPAFTQQSVDKNRRLSFMYNTPQMLMQAAQEHGIHAEACNRLDEASVAEHLSQGRLILALGSWAGSKPMQPLSWHWHLLHGYGSFETLSQQKSLRFGAWPSRAFEKEKWSEEAPAQASHIKLVVYTDPNGLNSAVTFEAYRTYFWSRLRFMGLNTQLEQFGLVLSEQAPTQEASKLVWSKPLRLIHGVYALVHATARFSGVRF
jgi:hypothetical protein